MKVKELIKELKKLPSDYNVAVSMHDNDEYEIAGHVRRVYVLEKGKFNTDLPQTPLSPPGEWVILHC